MSQRNYKIAFLNCDDLDQEIVRQAVTFQNLKLSFVDDETEADYLIFNDFFNDSDNRIGHILDQIESALLTNTTPQLIEYGDFILDTENHILKIKDYKVTLSDREKDIMIVLMQAGEEGCVRSSLLSKIWGYQDDLETHALETQIYRLRQKIETAPDTPEYLVTIKNGYKLSAQGTT